MHISVDLGRDFQQESIFRLASDKENWSLLQVDMGAGTKRAQSIRMQPDAKSETI